MPFHYQHHVHMIIMMSFPPQQNILHCDKRRSAIKDVDITKFEVYNEPIYPETLGNKCFQSKSHSLLSCFPPIYHEF